MDINKLELVELVENFIEQARNDDQSTKMYQKFYRDTEIKVGFGHGNKSKIPFMAFINYEQSVMKGIYPVILYSIEHDELITGYGISETDVPDSMWPDKILSNYKKINTLGWFRYGETYYKKHFKNISRKPNYNDVVDSITSIIDKFDNIFLNKALPSNEGVSLEFILDKNEISPTNDKVIYIYPLDDNWNDFGYKIRYNFHMHLEKEQTSEMELLFYKTKRSEEQNIPKYFSMLPSLKEYRKLMTIFGEDETKKILLSLNDLVALRHYPNSPEWIDKIEDLEVFKLAFMRNNTQFFTYHNAGDIIDGLDREMSDYISNHLQLIFKINKYENEHIFDFKFDNKSILPKNINLIIGKNGVGKSQALHNIVRSLTTNSEKLIDPSQEQERPVINRLLAIATPGETRTTYPRENKRNKIIYKRLLLSRDASKQSSRGIGSLIVQLLRSEDALLNKKRYQIFFDSIKALALDKIAIPVKEINDEYTLNIKDKPYTLLNSLVQSWEQKSLERLGNIPKNLIPYHYDKDSKELFPLSSGEVSFFLFALQATLFIENGTLVLLDEPETHLHPNLIIDFIEILNTLLKETGSYAIIATHSVYFARELPKSQIHVLKEEESTITVNTPRLKTFGANVNSISHFVFEDDTTNKMINKYKDRLTPEVIQELEQELSTEAIMKLKHLINKEENDESIR